MKILYEDRDIIVCVKEPGVPSQSDKSRDMDMVNMLRNYLASSGFGVTMAGGIPYIGLVHRLDRPVGGVMVFAKNPESLKVLNNQIQEKEINKSYLAIAMINNSAKLDELLNTKNYGIVHDSSYDKQALSSWFRVTDYLYKDSRTNLSQIVASSNRNGKKAELDFRIIGMGSREIDFKKVSTCMLEVCLLTGRHHQIRVQMAGQGLPLMGDLKYNNLYNMESGKGKRISNKMVALYSYRLEFKHPRTKKKMEFTSYPTDGWFIDGKEFADIDRL